MRNFWQHFSLRPSDENVLSSSKDSSGSGVLNYFNILLGFPRLSLPIVEIFVHTAWDFWVDDISHHTDLCSSTSLLLLSRISVGVKYKIALLWGSWVQTLRGILEIPMCAVCDRCSFPFVFQCGKIRGRNCSEDSDCACLNRHNKSSLICNTRFRCEKQEFRDTLQRMQPVSCIG